MKVLWQPKAAKQLKKIGDRNIQEHLLAASSVLADFPRCANVKTLTNHEYTHRLRVGNWRLLFDAFKEINIISIEEVKKRDDHTY